MGFRENLIRIIILNTARPMIVYARYDVVGIGVEYWDLLRQMSYARV